MSVEIGEHNSKENNTHKFCTVYSYTLTKINMVTLCYHIIVIVTSSYYSYSIVIVTSSQVPTIPTVVQGGMQTSSMIGMLIHCIVLKLVSCIDKILFL